MQHKKVDSVTYCEEVGLCDNFLFQGYSYVDEDKGHKWLYFTDPVVEVEALVDGTRSQDRRNSVAETEFAKFPLSYTRSASARELEYINGRTRQNALRMLLEVGRKNMLCRIHPY